MPKSLGEHLHAYEDTILFLRNLKRSLCFIRSQRFLNTLLYLAVFDPLLERASREPLLETVPEKEKKAGFTMHCTCGPHPRIDLTAAYSGHRHDTSTDSNNNKADVVPSSSCREQIRDACRSHGCFHATIDLSQYVSSSASAAGPASSTCHESSSPLSIECLSKPSKRIEEDIESLFSAPFLQSVIKEPTSSNELDDYNSNDVADNNWESICNGGLFEVPFPTSSIPSSAVAKETSNKAITKNASITSATFRGRVAESGDEQQSTPEPKLSWEFRRCIIRDNNNNIGNNDTTINTKEDNSHHDCDSWSFLPKWTEALHSIASMIIHLLDIPPQMALQEKQCQCSSQSENKSSCQRCCNIDLLRVFRYDALSPNDENMMGSSAHSDWGTLTVVWQDDKGGLQTYCHACDKWSNVDASSLSITTSASTTNECGNESKGKGSKLIVFVHVGDFLSLATMGECNKGSNVPMWPSPRHRVLCPTIQQNSGPSGAQDCRRSLVYFAYPPPGISLDAARKVVAPIASSSPTANKLMADDRPTEFYDYYSLLHNQSHQPSPTVEESFNDEKEGSKETTTSAAARRTHQLIKGVPFNKVIYDKWNQVQRES